MQHALVADGDIVADDRGLAFGEFGRTVCNVNDAVVLEVGARTDHDLVDVATHDGQRPQRRIVAHADGTEHHRARIDEHARPQFRVTPLEWTDVHRLASAPILGPPEHA